MRNVSGGWFIRHRRRHCGAAATEESPRRSFSTHGVYGYGVLLPLLLALGYLLVQLHPLPVEGLLLPLPDGLAGWPGEGLDNPAVVEVPLGAVLGAGLTKPKEEAAEEAAEQPKKPQQGPPGPEEDYLLEVPMATADPPQLKAQLRAAKLETIDILAKSQLRRGTDPRRWEEHLHRERAVQAELEQQWAAECPLHGKAPLGELVAKRARMQEELMKKFDEHQQSHQPSLWQRLWAKVVPARWAAEGGSDQTPEAAGSGSGLWSILKGWLRSAAQDLKEGLKTLWTRGWD